MLFLAVRKYLLVQTKSRWVSVVFYRYVVGIREEGGGNAQKCPENIAKTTERRYRLFVVFQISTNV